MQPEHFDDFTLASSWERCVCVFQIHITAKEDLIGLIFVVNGLFFHRFISEIEAVCRLWMSDGPKNLLVSIGSE